MFNVKCFLKLLWAKFRMIKIVCFYDSRYTYGEEGSYAIQKGWFFYRYLSLYDYIELDKWHGKTAWYWGSTNFRITTHQRELITLIYNRKILNKHQLTNTVKNK